MEKAPTLSFQCPKLWQDMPGSEKTRFCDQCGHSVKNLSLLDGVARQELLERAKTEKVCGTYYKDLDGKLVTADSEESLASKVGALRLAAIASGAVAIASCADKTEQREPVRPIGSEHRQLWGYICPPETNHKDAKLPITGPREPPQPNGILDELGEKQTSSENE